MEQLETSHCDTTPSKAAPEEESSCYLERFLRLEIDDIELHDQIMLQLTISIAELPDISMCR
jgi:hypothetical protein